MMYGNQNTKMWTTMRNMSNIATAPTNINK